MEDLHAGDCCFPGAAVQQSPCRLAAAAAAAVGSGGGGADGVAADGTASVYSRMQTIKAALIGGQVQQGVISQLHTSYPLSFAVARLCY